MKKTILFSLALAMVGGVASAQNLQDAFDFTYHDYYGTARSIAMGNAMTAIGGDLGSVTMNPAGSAVSKFSQFTITPNISVGGTNSTFYSVAGRAANGDNTTSTTRFTLPNIGFTGYFDTGSPWGIKGWSLGMIINQTHNQLDEVYVRGANAETSLAGAFAAITENNGATTSSLSGDNAYYGSAAWNDILGYQSGITSSFGGTNNQFLGVTEKKFDDGQVRICGPLEQAYGRTTHGSSNDMLFNFGMNINDKVYLGANFGITMNHLRNTIYIDEYAQNPSDFTINYDNGGTTCFDNLRYRYKYSQSASGVFLKLGAIVTPVKGLRFGAAIQTPTSLYIKERWRSYAETNFTDSYYNSWAETPQGEFTYRLRSPFRANVGVAYNAGGVVMLSADYEICDYKSMRFNDEDGNHLSYFDGVNRDIKNYARAQHQARFGVEVKPVPMFALRAGYTFQNAPEKVLENHSYVNVKNPKQTFSAGFGFSSDGSFYTDFAVRYMDLGKKYYPMYNDYIDDTPSPEILAKGFRLDLTWTIGFRF